MKNMKNMKKKKLTKDVIAKTKRDKSYQKHYEAASTRIRLSIEVSECRKERRLTQQALARMLSTTQKVVSKIENADTDIRISMLQRIAKILDFKSEHLAVIFDRSAIVTLKWSIKKEENKTHDIKNPNDLLVLTDTLASGSRSLIF